MICKQCGKETKNPKFCNNSCAASYNNKGVNRHKKREDKYCLNCKAKIPYKNIYCNAKCQKEYTRKLKIEKWLKGELKGYHKGNQLKNFVKDWLKESRGEKCEKCGWSEINPYTSKIPIEVEHIDGHWENDRPENLQLLCPNCHSLTKTFRGLNKGNGRPNRYQ